MAGPIIGGAIVLATGVQATAESSGGPAAPARAPLDALLESRTAGDATIDRTTPRPLSQPLPGLEATQRATFDLGEALFNTDFDASSGTRRSGLGPLFNAASCAACHNAGGRGEPVDAEGQASIALVMQLDEGDGKALPGTVQRSPRLAPALVGTGLLEAVPEAQILERADPDDRDGDGISGRPNGLRGADGSWRLGRFGWKASQATLEEQVASALANETGATSTVQPIDEHHRLTSPGGPAPAAEIGAADFAELLAFLDSL